MSPSDDAKLVCGAAEGGSAKAQFTLGLWHLQGAEGLEQDDVKAAACFREAADLGHALAQSCLAACYHTGEGVEQNFALAVKWGRTAADQGNADAQFVVGAWFALGKGVKKDLPLGKRYLELSAAQGCGSAVALLKELRKCVTCGKLDVHHMVCSRCHNRRYCDASCQLQHWNSSVDPHKLHCVKRRQPVEVGGSSSETADPSADNN